VDQKLIDIIIISPSRWDSVYSSTIFSLAKELAKTNRVFFIEHPYSWRDVWFKHSERGFLNKIKASFFCLDIFFRPPNIEGQFVAVLPPISMPINFLPSGKFYELMRKWNERSIKQTIEKIVNSQSVSSYIFINSFDPFFLDVFPDNARPLVNVYQSYDDVTQADYISRHGPGLEKVAIEKSDLAVATSRELCKKLSRFGKEIFYLPNAADTELFGSAYVQDLERPSDLPDSSKKIILYIGNISARVDHSLLRYIAERHSDKNLVIVGPKEGKGIVEFGLEQLPNLIFTGFKKFEELPRYLRYSDCTIIPFEKNELTKSIYPLKINEYLAAGKPVVTTDFSEDILAFKDVVYLSSSNDEFSDLINKAILEDNDVRSSERILFASNNTWRKRVETFWSYIFLTLKNRG
jgi:glycosyltransferase involved in cell wall biosynthesis